MFKRLIALLLSSFAVVAMTPQAEKPARQWPRITVKTADGWQGYFEPAILERLQSQFLDGLVFGGVQFAELASGQPVVELPAELFDREIVQAIVQIARADDEGRLDFLATMPFDRLRAVTVALDFLVCEHLHDMALPMCVRRMLCEAPIEQLPEYQAEIDRALKRCAPQFRTSLAAEFRGVVRGARLPECGVCALSHDGIYAITFGYDARLHVFDAQTGQEMATSSPVEFAGVKSPSNCFPKITCSPDKRFVAVGFMLFGTGIYAEGEKDIYGHPEYCPVHNYYTFIFNMAGGQWIAPQPLEGQFISFSPNGSKCALSHRAHEYAKQGTVTVHECADGRLLDNVACHTWRCQACGLHWLPNSERWCSFVDLSNGERRLEIHGDGFCLKLADDCRGCSGWRFSADGQTLACSQHDHAARRPAQIMVLDLRTKRTCSFAGYDEVDWVSSDGSRLVAHPYGSRGLEFCCTRYAIIDTKTAQNLSGDIIAGNYTVEATDDGARLLVSAPDKDSGVTFGVFFPDRIQVFDIADGHRIVDLPGVRDLRMNTKNGLAAMLAKDADGRLLLRFLDCYTGKVVLEYPTCQPLSWFFWCANGAVARDGEAFFDAAGNFIGATKIEGADRKMSDDGLRLLTGEQVAHDTPFKVQPFLYNVVNVGANPTAEQLLAAAQLRRSVQTSLPPEPK